MLNVTIERRNNWKHITKKEFTEEYFVNKNPDFAMDILENIMLEYEMFKEAEHIDNDKIQSLEVGSYDVDCGDYTYYIEIKEN